MYDMTIRLQTKGSTCLYEQIYAHIRQEIEEGRLLSGERLPSTRSMAEYLQVSRSTVDYAYEQLLSEGYIESRPCKGYFVCTIEEPLQIAERRVSPGQVSVKAEITEPEILYDFSPHAVDMSLFPYSVWKRITREVVSMENRDMFLQGEPQGDYELRSTIGKYLHSSRGVECAPEQIIIGAGNDYLLLLLEKILGRNHCIAMENPTYRRAYRIFKSCGYRVQTVAMDESGLQVSKLRKTRADLVYVMPSHQFPLGTVMPVGRRAELLGWAVEQKACIIEDDYDSEFRFRGKPIPSLQSADKQGSVIYMGTFSKAIAPAIRVSYMVLPPTLLQAYKENCGFYSCTVSRIDQKVLNEFIAGGYFERYLNRMRKCYRTKHDALLEALRPLQEHFRIAGEHAGLHILLEAKLPVAEQALIQAAREEGVVVYGLKGYEVEESGEARPATILLGFGGLSTEEIGEGIDKICKAWKKLIG
ncbi:MAG: PLP-dependent aminotransferase family protein [Lachnospiraceae bacterium]|nr:PLP-dependent aminotransferase family protein [Lachnospiraceae bacterium]